MAPNREIVEKIWSKIRSQCLKQKQSMDVIRWGHRTSRTFLVKESYNTLSVPLDLRPSPIWNRIWKLPLWPKVSHFLWLLMHRRILTWESLARKGFQGPSRCCLFLEQQETIDHLLDEYNFMDDIWKEGERIFQKHARLKGCPDVYIAH